MHIQSRHASSPDPTATGAAALIKREACQSVIVGGLFLAIADIGHPQDAAHAGTPTAEGEHASSLHPRGPGRRFRGAYHGA
jgi:hypothetical protein